MFLFKKKECTHDKISPDKSGQYCPDCGKYVENKWFLVKPEDMIKTHFPRREKHQYLKHPVDMKKIFRENARKKERNK